jgi:hypothetical protein
MPCKHSGREDSTKIPSPYRLVRPPDTVNEDAFICLILRVPALRAQARLSQKVLSPLPYQARKQYIGDGLWEDVAADIDERARATILTDVFQEHLGLFVDTLQSDCGSLAQGF